MKSTIISRQIGLDPNYKTWHSNHENMILYVHSGEGSIVCRDKIYSFQKGILCFIGAQVWHYTMPQNAKVYERSKLFVDCDGFDQLLSFVSQEESLKQRFHEESFVYARLSDQECEQVENLIRESVHYHGNRQYEKLVEIDCLLRLLTVIGNNLVDAVSPPKGDMNRAIEYINTHIYSDLRIEDICRHIHMSKYHFCRKFKKNTDLTVMEYILKTRIVLAKNMLAMENVSVSEVSERCGFGSISYFCRVFKEHTGETPLQFRKNQKKSTHRL